MSRRIRTSPSAAAASKESPRPGPPRPLRRPPPCPCQPGSAFHPIVEMRPRPVPPPDPQPRAGPGGGSARRPGCLATGWARRGGTSTVVWCGARRIGPSPAQPRPGAPLAVCRLPVWWRITGVDFTCLFRALRGAPAVIDASEPWDAVAYPGGAEAARRSWSVRGRLVDGQDC
jgi:hypothetical protein